MLDDGLYALSFESSSQWGEGLALLRGGQILGSDPHGGVFKGRCRYDAASGEAIVEVRLAVPPRGVLLTGLEAGPDGAFLDVTGRFPPPKPASSALIEIAGLPILVELRFVGPLPQV
ncbi:MAG TPA: hypothetical protein VEA77_01215 [Hyphomicrobium sp.]|nr:hypothetical protein [Hyphomicrobium sp.]